MEKTKLKDNKIFRWIIIPLCLALCFFGRFIPGNNGLTSDAIGVICIFIGTLILWLTIGIDWPSLVCLFSLCFIESNMVNILDPNDPSKVLFHLNPVGTVFQKSFGDPTFLFLLFTFICTYALSQTTIISRVAINFVNLKIAKRNGYMFMFLFLLAVLLLGCVISPTVLFVVMLPILNKILEVAGIEKDDKIAKVLMMGLGFTVSISSGMTPIAHVFPVLAMSVAKVDISPVAYMGFAIPVGIILFLLMFGLLILFIRPDAKKLKNKDVSILKADLPKIDKRDIWTTIIFVIVILLWIIPSLFRGLSEEFYQAINKYGTAIPPLFGAIALCIIRVDGKPLIKIGDALKSVPWPSLIMCAGALALGAALINPNVGIEGWLKINVQPALANMPDIAILIIFALWAALQTNLSSNMVTARLVSTVALLVLGGAATTLNFNAVVCMIGMLASFAFATPPSMPHIAIISGSESCNTKDVFLYGGLLMILSVLIALVIGYPLATLMM